MIFAPSREASLRRAVVISLFTWRRAETDDPLDDDERYGWWGDSYPSSADDRIGSRLWLLRRVKLTADTRRDAEFYAREALKWLIEDEDVDNIEILSEQVGANRLNLRVILIISTGARLEINSNQLWQVIYAV
ncbi:phage GP46 family protein [Pseudomonas sp. P115]|uniref:phage GP46 family protein n=1 Tax=Pseudomonas pisciculturae TaxID=2730413 RepID=UPI0018922C95|nr:phage GP46 family protein [Pseudomonas pisciculturae]MBF6030840.1 phage GP46 family protein [Pseudomonas pisciculturae]